MSTKSTSQFPSIAYIWFWWQRQWRWWGRQRWRAKFCLGKRVLQASKCVSPIGTLSITYIRFSAWRNCILSEYAWLHWGSGLQHYQFNAFWWIYEPSKLTLIFMFHFADLINDWHFSCNKLYAQVQQTIRDAQVNYMKKKSTAWITDESSEGE